MVGSACSGMSVFSLLMYIPAIMGFSAVLAVSSSIMLASVLICSGVMPMAFAFAIRSVFQNFLCSCCIRAISLSMLTFQYISYVFGMNADAIVAVSYPYLAQNAESVSARAMVTLSSISLLDSVPARRFIVLDSGMVRFNDVCMPFFICLKVVKTFSPGAMA